MKTIITHLTEGSAYNILQDIATGFQRSQILFSAVKIDLFTQIENGINTADSISTTLNLNKDALVQLLDALVALSLLEKHSGIYSNSALAAHHLIPNKEEFYGFLLHYANI